MVVLGRLLITLLLCEKGILREPSLYISYHFRQSKSEYYDRLQGSETEEIGSRGSSTSCVEFGTLGEKVRIPQAQSCI